MNIRLTNGVEVEFNEENPTPLYKAIVDSFFVPYYNEIKLLELGMYLVEEEFSKILTNYGLRKAHFYNLLEYIDRYLEKEDLYLKKVAYTKINNIDNFFNSLGYRVSPKIYLVVEGIVGDLVSRTIIFNRKRTKNREIMTQDAPFNPNYDFKHESKNFSFFDEDCILKLFESQGLQIKDQEKILGVFNIVLAKLFLLAIKEKNRRTKRKLIKSRDLTKAFFYTTDSKAILKDVPHLIK